MQLAIFDIDGTLLTGVSSERRFFMRLLRAGRLGPAQLFASAWFLLRWWPRYGRHVFKKNKAYLTGLPIETVATMARDWVATELDSAWYAPSVARLRAHREAGDSVVLLSGTPDFIGAAIATRFGATDCVASACDERDGRFGPRPPSRHPFGPDKLQLAQDICSRMGVPADSVVAYGDSYHDVELMTWAGKAIAVRPDQRLLQAARARHWEILGSRRDDADGAEPVSASRG
ncbi:MAG: haloacid dehalogenase-like hydrolase [Gammaproteobacteria bacterium]|nr:haloacid dehalogenase-like hydrolase [Gammaproteobacteria bacterium]